MKFLTRFYFESTARWASTSEWGTQALHGIHMENTWKWAKTPKLSLHLQKQWREGCQFSQGLLTLLPTHNSQQQSMSCIWRKCPNARRTGLEEARNKVQRCSAWLHTHSIHISWAWVSPVVPVTPVRPVAGEGDRPCARRTRGCIVVLCKRGSGLCKDCRSHCCAQRLILILVDRLCSTDTSLKHHIWHWLSKTWTCKKGFFVSPMDTKRPVKSKEVTAPYFSI